MSKPTSYTKDQLYGATKGVKRTYINKATKNEADARISKVQAYKLIAHKLKLSSDRSLWKNNDSEYLSTWYDKLIKDIDDILLNNQSIISSNSKDTLDTNQKSNYLEIISALEKRVENLTIENFELRQKLLTK
ncbi:hypothetical protein [Caryophanon tenue]|uniref:Uncharacterized protein n=1 Tax=Caryophanon tenue TaxID=33978 RepID=A0A1C0YKV3_9BACL|nr:hypothetical protein [Caryophanon tenue]OCS87815.1 hypothetical protein A6M13_10985 [Caryophanon tenue]